MDLRIPGLELHEPLEPRPLKGALGGLIAGLVVGLMTADRAIYGDQVILSNALGGLTAGLIIGVMLPLFRSRVLAGLAVGLAMSAAFVIAWSPAPGLSFGVKIFLGLAAGLIYATLFWDYQGGPR